MTLRLFNLLEITLQNQAIIVNSKSLLAAFTCFFWCAAPAFLVLVFVQIKKHLPALNEEGLYNAQIILALIWQWEGVGFPDADIHTWVSQDLCMVRMRNKWAQFIIPTNYTPVFDFKCHLAIV